MLRPAEDLLAGAPIPIAGLKDGSFVLSGVMPGRWWVDTQDPAAACIKSVRLAGEDVTGRDFELDSRSAGPLVIVLGARPGRIEGDVVATEGGKPARAEVLLVPEKAAGDPRRWSWTSTDGAAQFHFAGLAAGRYRLYALADVDVEAALVSEPGRLNELEKSSRLVELDEGRRESVTLHRTAEPEVR